jgi:hypothetical protein
MKSREDGKFRYYATELFQFMFQPFDDVLLNELQRWLNMGSSSDVKLTCDLLFKTPSDFILDHHNFVCGFLEQVKLFGIEMLNEAISLLYSSATLGFKSGPLGEPYSKDIEMAKKTEEILANLPRFSAAYKLYDAVKNYSEREIQQAYKQREALELLE